jgi:3-methyladenine DNA glycosylase AlkD
MMKNKLYKDKEILDLIEKEYQSLQGLSGSKANNEVARNIYPALPDTDEELLGILDYLVSTGEWRNFWLVTKWIKRKELYQLDYWPYYEKWLYEYVDSWGQCDVFCYRVLNPMVEKYPKLFENVLQWTKSSKTYVRRAAPVSLLQSTRTFIVNYSMEKVLEVVEELKDDQELHVQKGVGWLLKYAYLSYPDQIYKYLKENVDDLSRVIFRYALEKTPSNIKEELMSL